MRSLRDIVRERAAGQCECRAVRCGHSGRCNAPLGESWRLRRIDEDGPDVFNNEVVCESCYHRARSLRRAG